MWKDILRKAGEPTHSTQYILLGQSYLLKKNFNKAIAAYQKAIRLQKKSPKAQLFLASAWFKKGVNCSDVTGRDKLKWLSKAVIHYNKALGLSAGGIVGEIARRQLKEAQNSLTESKYFRILEELQEEELYNIREEE